MANTNKATPIDATEVDETVAVEVETDNDSYTHTFKSPLDYMGKKFDELTFNWAKLTGRDALAITAEMAALGKATTLPAFSVEYQVRMAVKACTVKLGSDAFDTMPLRDFNKITGAAQSFLLK